MASAAPGTAFRHLRNLFEGGPVAGLEDGQLLARYSLSNEGPAFEALVSRHGPMVLATCRAVLKNEHDVEDAFQATFLVLARKAHSIRGTDALGGWLHRVAYRASVQASIEARRRRRKEAEAAMARRDPSRPETELAAWLHEEVDRLPESLRLPVVLCDLEGLTYEEAAGQLGWTLPKIRHRLADGRQRLKGRLAGRGALPLAIGVNLAPKAPAAVPASLVGPTVASATGGAASPGVTLLAHTILRGMLMTKIKLTSAAALAAVALASAGVIAAGRAPENPETNPTPAAQANPAAKDAPAKDEPVDVRGIVVSPNGKPVAGARLTPTYHDKQIRPNPEAVSGPDGRFSVQVRRSRRQAGAVDSDLFPWLVASAPGFGPGWAHGILREGGAGELKVRLVEAGPTIEGRLIDLEGRPISGARVATHAIHFAKGSGGRADEAGDLSAWLEARRADRVGRVWDGLTILPAEGIAGLSATTGPDGRFRLARIGRERIADLRVTGPSIATTQTYVMTRDVPEVLALDETFLGPEPVIFHSPRFEQPIAPGKPVHGVARDKDTGRPIAGLTIRASVYHPQKIYWEEGGEATTDPEGRYTLTGLPKAPAYRVFVAPAPGLPYTNAVFKLTATDSPGLDPVTYDFALKRGVFVRGRITDKATGRPVVGHVNAFTFADSPGLEDYPGLAQSSPIFSYLDEDGRYEVVAPAGRAVVACQSDIRRYLVGQGAEKIAGYKPQFENFQTVPSFRGAVNYHALAEIRLDPKAEAATLDLQVDPGRSVALNVEDPEGRPIGDLKAEGTSQTLLNLPIRENSSTVDVRGLDPAKPRRVVVRHDGRKLAGSIRLKGDEAGPIILRLQPWGTVTGRVVDDEGKRGQFRTISAGNSSASTRPEEAGIFPGGSIGGGLSLERDGRFRLEGLVPGLKYAAAAGDGEISILGDLFKDVTVAPGEVKDLGDLKVTPYKP